MNKGGEMGVMGEGEGNEERRKEEKKERKIATKMHAQSL